MPRIRAATGSTLAQSRDQLKCLLSEFRRAGRVLLVGERRMAQGRVKDVVYITTYTKVAIIDYTS
jgi:hypothetical protein